MTARAVNIRVPGDGTIRAHVTDGPTRHWVGYLFTVDKVIISDPRGIHQRVGVYWVGPFSWLRRNTTAPWIQPVIADMLAAWDLQ